jgi:hypothetical protein
MSESNAGANRADIQLGNRSVGSWVAVRAHEVTWSIYYALCGGAEDVAPAAASGVLSTVDSFLSFPLW